MNRKEIIVLKDRGDDIISCLAAYWLRCDSLLQNSAQARSKIEGAIRQYQSMNLGQRTERLTPEERL